MMAFDEIIFAHLQSQLPDYLVASDVANDVALADKTLLVNVAASEMDANDDWSSEESPLWAIEISVTLIADTASIGVCAREAHNAVKALQFKSIIDTESGDPAVKATVLRVTTSSAFTTFGQTALVGGKQMTQKTGQYSTVIKEAHNGTPRY